MTEVFTMLANTWQAPLLGVGLLALAGASSLAAWGSVRLRRVALLPGLARPRPQGIVRSLDEGTLTLERRGARQLRTTGTWGLEWPGGYGRVGAGVRSGTRCVTYTVESLRGTISVGELVEFDARAYELEECGFSPVEYPATSSRFQAWVSMGRSDVWVVGVHGQSGSPAEMPRAARVAQAMGLSTLLISYRNDPGQIPTHDGFFDFGRSEWEELDGAVGFACRLGARRVVLMANSMGAALVGWWLRQSEQINILRGVFLDSPLLDLPSAIHWTARRTGIPPGVARAAMGIESRRHGIEWHAYDVRDDFVQSIVPVLIMHGDRDGQVPISLSDSLAARSPDRVRLIRVEGAGHGQSWNHDPRPYEQAVRDFLAEVLAVR